MRQHSHFCSAGAKGGFSTLSPRHKPKFKHVSLNTTKKKYNHLKFDEQQIPGSGEGLGGVAGQTLRRLFSKPGWWSETRDICVALQSEDRFSLFIAKKKNPFFLTFIWDFFWDFAGGQGLFWEPYNQSERLHCPHCFPLLNCASVWLRQAKQGPPVAETCHYIVSEIRQIITFLVTQNN